MMTLNSYPLPPFPQSCNYRCAQIHLVYLVLGTVHARQALYQKLHTQWNVEWWAGGLRMFLSTPPASLPSTPLTVGERTPILPSLPAPQLHPSLFCFSFPLSLPPPPFLLYVYSLPLGTGSLQRPELLSSLQRRQGLERLRFAQGPSCGGRGGP